MLGLIEILRESKPHYHMSLLVYIKYLCFNPKVQCLFNLESYKELHDLSRVGSIETGKEESSNKISSFGTCETHVALFFGGFVSKVHHLSKLASYKTWETQDMLYMWVFD